MDLLTTFHGAATLLSLALTMVALAGCAAVTFYWWRGATNAYFSSHRTESGWFMLGVAIHFAFSFVDNSYWGITWGIHYVDKESAAPWFDGGVYPNILFRQIGTAVAAYCHLRAALASDNPVFKWLLYGSCTAGGLLVVVLTIIKNSI